MDKLLELRTKAAKWLLCTEETVDKGVVGIISFILLIGLWIHIGYV